MFNYDKADAAARQQMRVPYVLRNLYFSNSPLIKKNKRRGVATRLPSLEAASPLAGMSPLVGCNAFRNALCNAFRNALRNAFRNAVCNALRNAFRNAFRNALFGLINLTNVYSRTSRATINFCRVVPRTSLSTINFCGVVPRTALSTITFVESYLVPRYRRGRSGES